MPHSLIDQIYEAAIVTELWPDLLQQVASRVDARGAVLVEQSPVGIQWVASPGIEQDVGDYMAEGWGNDFARVAPLFAEQHPGFRSETQYCSPEELARMPVHAEFLSRRGLGAAAATLIQGAADHAIHIAIEGFGQANGAELAVAELDTLRSHLSRSASLAALARRQRDLTIVAGLQAAGAGAALINAQGHLRAANDRFLQRLSERMIERHRRLLFTDRFLQAQFEAALGQMQTGSQKVYSLAMSGQNGDNPFVVHIIPLRAAAREFCDTDGLLVLIADGSNRALPDANLLRCLYDLTPAEARLARRLTEGMTLAQVASETGVGIETVRSHLRSIFGKTGVHRQAELTLLLTGIAPPSPIIPSS